MVDVINLCRNFSDGERGETSPVSFIYFRKHVIVHLFSVILLGRSSIARNSFFTILLCTLPFLVTVDRHFLFAYPLSDYVQESV